MNIFALADLHLGFGVQKSMDIFGPLWQGHAEQIENHWRRIVSPEDLVLLPGDISWAMHLEDALPDLAWIDSLPGTKVMIRGNHDYWWSSLKKMGEILPPSLHILQNNAFHWKGVAVAGSRLWDTPEYRFGPYIDFQENPVSKPSPEEALQEELQEKIFLRELERLHLSLSKMDPAASYKIAMTHYPPIGPLLEPSRASALLEEFGIDLCVFGHLHNIREGATLFGKKNQIDYLLVAADYVRFQPVLLYQTS